MISPSEMLFVISKFSFYTHLDTNEKIIFKSNIVHLIHKKGIILHNQNDSCLGTILIKSGTLRIYIMSDEGREVTLYTLSAGEVCILSSICILPISFNVHLTAETNLSLYLIPSNIFSQLSTKNIYVKNFSYETTIKRFGDVMHTMEQLLFIPVNRRLAQFLLGEMNRTNSQRLCITQDQIALLLGSAREVISRTLNIFQKKGLVIKSRGSITIIDSTGLHMI